MSLQAEEEKAKEGAQDDNLHEQSQLIPSDPSDSNTKKAKKDVQDDNHVKEQSKLLSKDIPETGKKDHQDHPKSLETEKEDDAKKKCNYDLWAQYFNVIAMGGYMLQDILYFTIDVSQTEFSTMMTMLGFLCCVNAGFCLWEWKSGLDKTKPAAPLYRNIPFLAEFFNILGSLCLMMSGIFTYGGTTVVWAKNGATVFDQMALWVIMLDTLLQFATAKRGGEFTKPFSSVNPVFWGHILNVVPQLIYVIGWLLDMYQKINPEALSKRHGVQHYTGPAKVTRCCNMDGVVFLTYFAADVLYFIGALFWLWGCFIPDPEKEETDDRSKA